MPENATPTNPVPQLEPTDPDQEAQHTPHDHAGMSETQMPLGQRGPLAKPSAPGRMPLFRR